MNLEWGDDGTVSYKRVKYWYFQRNMSVGPLTDMVTTINVPVVGSAEFVRGDFFLEWGISDMLSTIQVGNSCQLIIHLILYFTFNICSGISFHNCGKISGLLTQVSLAGDNICQEKHWRAVV